MKRRIEIIVFERQRIVMRPTLMTCPVCQTSTEFLTTRQAGMVFQVRATSIRRWIVQGKAHGIRTPGGQHRVCRNSLWSNRLDSVFERGAPTADAPTGHFHFRQAYATADQSRGRLTE
ncbi:MAG TPA: hypothetical protein VN687_07430 [Blastocatellia bacterium]|nr:hypothetical protein [Blastocatellia bacterium]